MALTETGNSGITEFIRHPVSLDNRMAVLFTGLQGEWMKRNPYGRRDLTSINTFDIENWINQMPSVWQGLTSEAEIVLDSFRNPSLQPEPQYQLHPQMAELAKTAYRETDRFVGFDIIAGSPTLRIHREWLVQDVVVVKTYERTAQGNRAGSWQVSPPLPFFEGYWPAGYQNQLVELWKKFTDSAQILTRPIRVKIGKPGNSYTFQPLNTYQPDKNTFDLSLNQWKKHLAQVPQSGQLKNFQNHPFTRIYHDPNRFRDGAGRGYQGIKVMMGEPEPASAIGPVSFSLPFIKFMELTKEQFTDYLVQVFEARLNSITPVIKSAKEAADMFNTFTTVQFHHEIRKPFLSEKLERFNQTLFALWPGILMKLRNNLLTEDTQSSAIQIYGD